MEEQQLAVNHMDRRQFVKLIGGLVVVAALTPLIPTLESFDRLKAKSGPQLRRGITLNRLDSDVTQGFYDHTLVFEVDSLGAKLLALASGDHTITSIAKKTSTSVDDVGLFFLELGQAGYLERRIELTLVGRNA